MLILTYIGGNDGFGAQFERIIGIYAIARHLGIAYHHTPISRIDNMGIISLQSRFNRDKNKSASEGDGTAASDSLHQYVEDCNRRIKITSTIDIEGVASLVIKDQGGTTEERNLSLEVLTNLRDQCLLDHTNILYRIHSPYHFTHNHPEIFDLARLDRSLLYKAGVLGQSSPQPLRGSGYVCQLETMSRSQHLTVGIHLRRGDLVFSAKERSLPITYYLEATLKILEVVSSLGVQPEVELYTESPTETFVVTGNIEGIANLGKRRHRLEPDSSEIEIFDEALRRQYPSVNFTKYINEYTLDTFDRMVDCDILIASLSSFSTAAAILKGDKGVTVHYTRYPHVLPEDLCWTDDDFESQLESLLKGRGTSVRGTSVRGTSVSP